MLKQITKKEFIENLDGTQFVNSFFHIDTMEKLNSLINNTVANIDNFLQQIKIVPVRKVIKRQTQSVQFSGGSWLDFSGKRKKCYKYTIEQGTWYIIVQNDDDDDDMDRIVNVIIYWKEM